MKIYLVGLPGSGKSFLGKKLSELTRLPFIDLDAELEKQEGRSVSEIFAENGEDYFRAIEADVLRKQSAAKEFVMATGGGVPCFHGNMDFINQMGTGIFLNPPVQTIAERITPEEKNRRPLFTDIPSDQMIKKLESLLQKRIAWYQRAQFTFSEPDVTAEDILRIISTGNATS